MKKAEILNRTSGIFHKLTFKLKKHSPEILITAGVIGVIGSTVMLCRATLKAQDILNESKEQVDKVHQCLADESLSGQYSTEDSKKDLTIVYAQTGVKLAKLYMPAVLLGGASITGIIASHTILCKRNAAIAAAYAMAEKGFKAYRNRVAERFGEDVERELRYNIKAQTFEKTVTNSETGDERKEKVTVPVAELDDYSEYARFFDSYCTGWEKNAEYNLMFLRAQQQYANDLLRSRGHLFLNEVYDMLGMPRSKSGQIVGWVYDANNPVGDNYVDFGIFETNRVSVQNFLDGYERTVLLDFNVDGNILDLI